MNRFFGKLLVSIGLLGIVVGFGSASADTLPAPSGPVILVVDGKIGVSNQSGEAHFDHQYMLAAIDTHAFTTSNPWDEKVSVFEGIRLTALMDALQADGTSINVLALDGYEVEVPVSDFAEFSPILAWTRDGEIMSVRDKGPLWLVYPYDSHAELSGEKFSARSVWQVERITFE